MPRSCQGNPQCEDQPCQTHTLLIGNVSYCRSCLVLWGVVFDPVACLAGVFAVALEGLCEIVCWAVAS